jgi:hypothetical protein
VRLYFWPLKVHKHEIFFLTFFAETETLWSQVGCALTFASEAKFEIEAKISFRLEAKKKPDFT